MRSSAMVSEKRTTGVVGEELGCPVDLIEALVEEGELDGTGAIWSANVVKVRRFLNVKLENRFLKKVVAKQGSFLLER